MSHNRWWNAFNWKGFKTPFCRSGHNYCFQPFCRLDLYVHWEFCEQDETEHVETGHSRLNSRTYVSIAKQYLNSATCVTKPVKCHDRAYLLCLMTVKVISLLNFMCQHSQVCTNVTKFDKPLFHTHTTWILDLQQLYIYDAIHLELSLNY